MMMVPLMLSLIQLASLVITLWFLYDTMHDMDDF